MFHRPDPAMNPAGSGHFRPTRLQALGTRLSLHTSAVAVAGVMLGAWHRRPALALECIACCFGLTMLREAGHAAIVRWLGCRVTAIRLSAVHGLCVHDAPDTARDDALVAWGGVDALTSAAESLGALGKVRWPAA